jgi:hypothetical protein
VPDYTVHRYATAKRPKKGKYGNYSATYNGYTYMSRKEALFAAELDTLRKAYMPKDRVVSFERQVKVSLDVNGKHVANYYMDFVVKYADGREEWIEVKGYETAEWKLKAKLFVACYPDRIYRIVR